MAIEVGDLVQFKLEHANRKKVWRTLPAALHDYDYVNANYLFSADSRPNWNYRPGLQWEATSKVGMVVIGFNDVCFARSKNPTMRRLATKRFAKLMLFSSNPTQAPMAVWALEEELELFDDKPYLESLKARLRETVAQKRS